MFVKKLRDKNIKKEMKGEIVTKKDLLMKKIIKLDKSINRAQKQENTKKRKKKSNSNYYFSIIKCKYVLKDCLRKE